MNDQVFDGLLLLFSLINTSIHTLAYHILQHITKNGHDPLKYIYLSNLSKCQIVMNAVMFTRCVVHLIKWPHFEQFNEYADILILAGCGIVYYFSISLVTIDRLFDILLNIRYPLYCTPQKARRILYSAWLLGLIVAIIIAMLVELTNLQTYHILFTYMFPFCNSVYVVLAAVTYIFIFQKFKNTRDIPSGQKLRKRKAGLVHFSKLSVSQAGRLVEIYRNSRFHLPVLNITSFLVFKIVPDLVSELVGCRNIRYQNTVLHVCLMSYAVSGMVSAYLHLLTHSSIKNLVKKKIRKIKIRLAWSDVDKLKDSNSIILHAIPQWQRDIVVGETLPLN